MNSENEDADTGYEDPGTGDVRAEIQAMSEAYEALRGLPQAGRERAMRWLDAKFATTLATRG